MAEQRPLSSRSELKQNAPKPAPKEEPAKVANPTQKTTVKEEPAKSAKPVNPLTTLKAVTDQQKRPFLPKLMPKKIQQRLADLQEFAIAIDSFDDIFSDFDPREFTKRDLSVDFITELKRRYKVTGVGQFDVAFHAPRTIHNEADEKIIISRIKQHFRQIINQNKKHVRTIRFRGMLYIGFGIVLLTFLTFATSLKLFSDLHIQLFGIIFMPLGWFGVWEGFSKIVDIPWKLQEELEFCQKMARANYQFKFLE